ncbi:hypothetical protein, partial [Janthinobacterium sp. HH104]|uniref:hypothetical protein n=1 Tax=Janthinobacterium sp. HH104 TaxID=1537276 RepID=UPI001C30FE3E
TWLRTKGSWVQFLPAAPVSAVVKKPGKFAFRVFFRHHGAFAATMLAAWAIVKYPHGALCHSAKPCYNLVLGGCSSAG